MQAVSCKFLHIPEQVIFVLIDLLLQHCNINTFLIMEHIFELERIFAMEHFFEMEYRCKTSVH